MDRNNPNRGRIRAWLLDAVGVFLVFAVPLAFYVVTP